MKTVVGVRFRQAGKVHYYFPGSNKLSRGEHVIVNTAKGMEMGTVILPNTEMKEEKLPENIEKIIRIATKEDEEKESSNREKEKEAFGICKEKIRKHELEMKLIAAEYTFDRNKLLFYFTADGRVDFRELVKDLAGVFRTRIELRQIGVRDETKICGGIGMGAQVALSDAGIQLYGGVKGSADEAAKALAEGKLSYDPDVKCDHHGHHEHEGHCGHHGHHQGEHCGHHQ